MGPRKAQSFIISRLSLLIFLPLYLVGCRRSKKIKHLNLQATQEDTGPTTGFYTYIYITYYFNALKLLATIISSFSICIHVFLLIMSALHSSDNITYNFNIYLIFFSVSYIYFVYKTYISLTNKNMSVFNTY